MNTLQQIIGITGVDIANTERNRFVLNHLLHCGTAYYGYHLYSCSDTHCGYEKIQYHACHDRHCPRCSYLGNEQWKDDRTKELLPVTYYHAVFTLPHQLNPLLLGNMSVLYNLLYDAAWYAVKTLSAEKRYFGGATPGMLSVIHTWGQQLSYHVHLHTLITGGGIKEDGRWVSAPVLKEGFFLPLAQLRERFQNYYIGCLKHLIDNHKVIVPPGFDLPSFFSSLENQDWVVYIKDCVSTPLHVIDYLGRYIKKIAISNNRIWDVDNNFVTFSYKDYDDNGKVKLMKLDILEFMRRWALHILPKRFVKIRFYGLWANRGKTSRINNILKQLNLPPHPLKTVTPFFVRLIEEFGVDIFRCPKCKNGTMQLTSVVFPARASPSI